MKRITAIILAIIMLSVGLTISIDRHYCSGNLTGIKLSLSEKLASCGMESEKPSNLHEIALDKKCCEDQLSCINISSQYFPEYFSVYHPPVGKFNHSVPVNNFLINTSDILNIGSHVLPPGNELKPELTQSRICVFRI